MKILLLKGGSSNEREVSLRSAAHTESALQDAGYEVTSVDIANADIDLADLLATHDLVFPIIHGVGGEDGSIQTLLESSGAKYLGSDAHSSALAFNKIASKEAMAEHGVLTPNWQVVGHADYLASGLIHRPFVLKPIAGGSSIDTFIVHNPGHETIDVDAAFEEYGEMLLEELIVGQEVTVSILDDEILPIILIIPPRGEEFDYENKYNGKTQEIVAPQSISPQLTQEAQHLALRVHRLIGLRHLSRTDMIITPDGAIYVLEINTMPGLTEQSLYPKSAAEHGLTMPQLVKRFVELALG